MRAAHAVKRRGGRNPPQDNFKQCCKAVVGRNVRVSEMTTLAEETHMRLPLSCFISGISQPLPKYDERFSFFVPIAEW